MIAPNHQPGCDGSGSHKNGCTNGPKLTILCGVCSSISFDRTVNEADHRCAVCGFDVCVPCSSIEYSLEHDRIDWEANEQHISLHGVPSNIEYCEALESMSSEEDSKRRHAMRTRRIAAYTGH